MLNVVVLSGLFLGVFVLILIFLRNGSLPVTLLFSGGFVVRLAVLWHYNHLRSSVAQKQENMYWYAPLFVFSSK